MDCSIAQQSSKAMKSEGVPRALFDGACGRGCTVKPRLGWAFAERKCEREQGYLTIEVPLFTAQFYTPNYTPTQTLYIACICGLLVHKVHFFLLFYYNIFLFSPPPTLITNIYFLVKNIKNMLFMHLIANKTLRHKALSLVYVLVHNVHCIPFITFHIIISELLRTAPLKGL